MMMSKVRDNTFIMLMEVIFSPLGFWVATIKSTYETPRLGHREQRWVRDREIVRAGKERG